MANVFILHGTGGYPKENWFPWLKKELKLLGHNVIVPKFPTPKKQTLKNWFKVFDKYKKFYNKDTILVGHSLGGAFLLKILEKHDVKIKAAFIVAAPVGVKPIKNWKSDKLFLEEFNFKWKKIKNNCSKFLIFHSDNDPYVSLGNGKETSKRLKTKLIFIPNAGHFNKSAGYLKFNILLKKIKSILH